ncbi:MAG: hypothetical protein HGA78_08740, partial [Nitrospirales bacterium]|nr:hypothetical protein [Nitrospirales bacterium]
MKKAGSGFRALLLFVGLSFLLVQGGIGEAFGYEGLSRASGARCSEPNNAVSAYFRVIDTASPELKQAIRQFPKGADLHNHLSGSIMPETYIEMGKKDGNCYGTDPVDPTMRTIIAHTGTPDSCPQGSLPLSRITADDFQRLVASLSMYRYPYTDIQSGHDQFFATFGRFGVESGSRDNRGIMLAHLLRKASEDNLSYVETMMSFQSAAISNLADKLRQKYPDDSCYTGTGRYLEMLDFLMQSGLADAVTAAREDIAFYRDKARTTLQCGTPDQDKACLVSYAMVAEVNRNSGIKGSSGAPDLPKIFTQTAFSFLLSLREKNVVAVDLVSGEDLPVSMQSFRTVMQFFSFFHSHQTYKDVNISLHAGEITPC